MNLKITIFTLILLFAYSWNKAQTFEPKFDDYCQQKMQRADVIGMQVGYLNAEGAIYTGSYGVINHVTNVDVNDSTLFMIASCSKPVTALAVIKLIDEGKIDFDTDINRYLPFEISNPYHPEDSITPRMLLSHTGTLKDNWSVLDPLYTTDVGGDSPLELKKFIWDYFTPEGLYYKQESNFYNKTPGTYWNYCNKGYAILGLLIEEISGKSFSQYMDEDIFQPLGMHNSYWFFKDIPHKNIARPHVLPDEKSDTIKMLKHYGFPDFPDGQLRTTAQDYLKFVKLIVKKGKLGDISFIKEELIEQFYTVQFPEVHKYQAVAWNYNEFENFLYYLLMKRLPSHTGGDPGVATVVSFNPVENTAAVVFMNSPPVTFKGGKILYLDLIKRLLKEAEK